MQNSVFPAHFYYYSVNPWSFDFKETCPPTSFLESDTIQLLHPVSVSAIRRQHLQDVTVCRATSRLPSSVGTTAGKCMTGEGFEEESSVDEGPAHLGTPAQPELLLR